MATYVQVGNAYIEFPDSMTQEQIGEALKTYKPQAPLQQEPSMWESAKESVTGNQRTTPEIEQMDRVDLMPELNDWSLKNVGYSLRTMLTQPKETAEVIKANYPEVQIRQDPKGNYVFKSARDGKEYAIKPGLGITDVIGGAAAGALGYTGATLAAPLAAMAGGGYTGAAITGAASQLPIELAKLPGGGSVSPMDMAVSTALGPALHGAGSILRTAKNAILPPSAATQAAQVVSQPAAQVAQQASTPAAQQQAVNLVRNASGSGYFANKAKNLLATNLDPDVEAVAAAGRLGVANDLPADVLSQNTQLRNIAGATRSEVGSKAEAGWQDIVKKTADKFDVELEKLGAIFDDGKPSASAASSKIRETLKADRDALNKQATDLYDEVNAVIPKETTATFPKLTQTLAEVEKEVGLDGMTAQEKRLFGMINGETEPTYGRLLREKNLIGKAIAGKESPYGSMDEATLKRLYGALAEDQIASVKVVGGEDLAEKLVKANDIYFQERELGDKIVKAFGRDLDGSISGKLIKAMTSASKDDEKLFTEIMKVVPEELKGETLLTALASATRAKQGIAKNGFGFQEYANVYGGLRGDVKTALNEHLKGEKSKTLHDLFRLSKYITDARAKVLTTGKANQVLKDQLSENNLVGKIMSSTLGKAAVTGAAATATGGMGAAAVPMLTNFVNQSGKKAMIAAGDLFTSQELKDLIAEGIQKGMASDRAVKRLAISKAFANYAKEIKLPMTEAEKWIQSGLKTTNLESDKK